MQDRDDSGRLPAGRRARPDWAAIRAAYEADNETVREICAAHGIRSACLYERRAAEGWRRRADRRKPSRAARARAVPRPSGRARSGERAALVRRLYRRFTSQLEALDARLESVGDAAAATDGEKEARALATLARTLEKLIEIEDGIGRADAARTGGARDRTEHDVDRLRLALARRIERLARSAGEGPVPDEPEEA